MKVVKDIQLLREMISVWRSQGNIIAFVPTMGNLHAGHIKLVNEARKQADKIVVSIFVNPMQFGPEEDFNSYPRTEQEDIQKLEQAVTDVLFLPAVNQVYASNAKTVVSVAGLSKLHCGENRPGHFDGVATVVTKLFNMVQPDLSFFGKKDFQQLLLIRTLVEDLNMPVEIIAVETERENDGLAMSSRNAYLSDKERLTAPALYRALVAAKEAVIINKLSFRAIEQQQIKQLESLGFIVDYFSICNSGDLQAAIDNDKNLVILVAAKLGLPRLIDNICYSRLA